MYLLRALLFNAAAVLSFASFTGAAEAGAASVFAQLVSGVPAADAAVAIAGQTVKAPPPEAVDEAGAIPPGGGLLPEVEDKVRVDAILKLVGDIYNHAPLPYKQDGAVFTNREGRLPARPSGYYREYTLLTGDAPHTVTIGGHTYQVAPDLSPRGSERCIVGGGAVLYYTPDHYENFIELKVVG
jgi:guanyl-specific ribonuclease Sa